MVGTACALKGFGAQLQDEAAGPDAPQDGEGNGSPGTPESMPELVDPPHPPLTFSIADGIGIGFISYVALSLLASEERKVSWGALVIAGLFVIKFALL